MIKREAPNPGGNGNIPGNQSKDKKSHDDFGASPNFVPEH
jgi:hypothetical protein